jgi:hypothetical protein
VSSRENRRLPTEGGGQDVARHLPRQATAEYHNAGGWPTSGFSQSSGIPNEWNYWIIYPAIAWVLWTAAHAWWAYGRKPVSETDIQQEIERQAGQRR